MNRTSPLSVTFGSSFRAVSLLAGLLLPAVAAQAAVRDFAVADGNWGVGANWSGGAYPVAGDTARVDNNRTVQITNHQEASILHVGFTSTTGTNNFLNIATTGTLTLAGESRLGYSAGTKGTATVAGLWTGISTFYIGGAGEGNLTVATTGTVNASAIQMAGGSGSIGRAEVNGVLNGSTASIGHAVGGVAYASVSGTWSNSSTLTIGTLGNLVGPGGAEGHLVVNSGGLVSSVGLTTIASGSNTTATALVRGTLSNTGDIRVGTYGAGKLTAGAGGQVNVNGGTGVVHLAFTASASGALNIGGDVTGTTPATAEGAGVLNAAEVRGRATGGTTFVNFNHTGSDYHFTKTGLSGGASVLLTGQTLAVTSFAGSTRLSGANTYGAGTTIRGATARIIAAHNSALGTGAASVREAGVLEVASGIAVGNAITLDGGHLLLTSGTASGAVAFAGTAGSLSGSGHLSGALTLTSGNTLAAGGGNLGTLTFGNPLTLASGSVTELQLHGFDPGEYDLLQGGGGVQITLGGTLRIDFGSGFATEGSALLVDFSDYGGAFANVEFSGLAAGYFASFDDGTGMVTVIPEPSTWALLAGAAGLALLRRRRA